MEKQTNIECDIVLRDYRSAVESVETVPAGNDLDEALKRVEVARERLDAMRLKIQLEAVQELAEMEEMVSR